MGRWGECSLLFDVSECPRAPYDPSTTQTTIRLFANPPNAPTTLWTHTNPPIYPPTHSHHPHHMLPRRHGQSLIEEQPC